MLTVACVLKTGGDFNEEHVQRLQRNVAAYLPFTHRFVALSDIAIDGVETEPLLHDWPGWWSKWELYRLKGPVIFFDLDTLILSDLTPLLKYAVNNPFSMLSDFYFPTRHASGLMCWNEDVTGLYDAFVRDVPKNKGFFGSRSPIEQKMVAEYYQELTGGFPRMLQNYVPGIHSYKVHGVRQNGMVLCFHGKPRPWACQEVASQWNRYIIHNKGV